MARSVFYDLADTPEEAANLTARAAVMIAIEERIKELGWTQTKAAGMLHVNQPRVSDLMTGKLHKFSLDALVNMLPAVGLAFDVRPDPLAAEASAIPLPRRRAEPKKRSLKRAAPKKKSARHPSG